MSVAVAIIGADGAAVAGDSRRVESDGTVRDDFSKVFAKMEGRVIGAHTGLLEIGGRAISDLLDDLPWDQIRDIDHLASAAKDLLEAALTSIDPDEAALEGRRLDLLLVARPNLNNRGRPVLRALTFRPDTSSQQVVGRIDHYASGWSVIGDDTATAAVVPVLRDYQPAPGRLSRFRRETLAKTVVIRGISAAGPHARYPDTRSCGGPVSIVSL